jgi:hypothetical protein
MNARDQQHDDTNRDDTPIAIVALDHYARHQSGE